MGWQKKQQQEQHQQQEEEQVVVRSIVKIFFQKHQIDFSAIPFEEAPFQFRRIRYIYVMFALAEVI